MFSSSRTDVDEWMISGDGHYGHSDCIIEGQRMTLLQSSGERQITFPRITPRPVRPVTHVIGAHMSTESLRRGHFDGVTIGSLAR